ncbi:hypothetical protein SAMN05216481_108183 [Streptomyces radiopugnans]|uniref:Uncharacterized protein n=1 Tax=Streptomyces radiopugnans TaxID=403935 RepID=A0A1H9GAD5_9ACTN|nr:hypothetical protein SAMN05216481_108183 [Streptomyces radiopugnans]
MEGVIDVLGSCTRTGHPTGAAGNFSWRGARLVVRDSARTAGRSGLRGRPGGGGGARLPAYRAEAVAVGAVNGGAVAVQLGACEAADHHRALDWLRGQARRIADGLDPDPRTARWAPGGAFVLLRGCPAGAADAPERLRRWHEDEGRQRAAAELLARGEPFHLAVADHTGTYVLSARPVGTAAP